MAAFAGIPEEVLGLIAETGDRCIVVSETHGPYMIMTLDQYRALLSAAAARQELSQLSETDLLERINREIADWREAQESDFTDYDVAQFRLQKKPRQEPRQAAVTQPKVRQAPENMEKILNPLGKTQGIDPRMQLPVVDEEPSHEYHLEPLE
ncbi:MAG: hypothetical protein A3B30_00345 [Candidatus Komeilibacteria bacterium RIFCSPLOWO2_01_FULL_52_15]|uniref:Uncharacterized protein n=1 Tax=Candidatus Komeilibacteria bacterium RIFCSPLOWO2_01_FULL_52_15 TaxID=1798551 RepID=A0A1G2BPJ5_9BACT|nr:MAG: hypothetical protein A3B30_00345 [Candidatus Komeilibacteria bacterium RIFCSPLOWO2_01_FULL_52_15]